MGIHEGIFKQGNDATHSVCKRAHWLCEENTFLKAKENADGPVRLPLRQMRVDEGRSIRLQYVFANGLDMGVEGMKYNSKAFRLKNQGDDGIVTKMVKIV